MNRSLITADQIGTWAKSIAYQLDEPAVVALNEMTATVPDWSDEDTLKTCMMAGVEYSSIVANLGIMILLNEINEAEGLMCERAYFPEKKLYTRLLKKAYPLFSKETFHPLNDFEVLMFSSYFPVQYFNLPKMLEMANIPAFEKDRDGKNAPIVIAGGINTFNPEPIADFVDAVFLGEGEEKLVQVLQVIKSHRIYEGNKLVGIDKDAALHELARRFDFIYVPKFYEPTYFKGLGVKKMTVLDPDATLEPTRALCNLFKTKPLVNTYVPVCDSADMSVGAVEVSRGCSASCNFCIDGDQLIDTPNGPVKFKDLNHEDYVLSAESVGSVKTGYQQIYGCAYQTSEEAVWEFVTNKGMSVRCTSDHRVKIYDGRWVKMLSAYNKAYPLFPTDVNETEQTRIVAMHYVGVRKVYDITVPETHEFVIGGMHLHNCEGSARTMPLRERSLTDIFNAFEEVKRNTGCYTAIPYGFNLSDHTNIRTILKHMLAGKDTHVQMSSQRIDLFTYDLAAMAKATGTSSLTLAIESGSEKGRRVINKNLTLPQILETFEIAFSLKYLKIKIYMIANPPFESQSDLDGEPTQLVTPDADLTLSDGRVVKASDIDTINEHLAQIKSNRTWKRYDHQTGYKITYEDGTTQIVNAEYMLYRKNSPAAQEIAVAAATLEPGDIVTDSQYVY